jgi:hypothetical protein
VPLFISVAAIARTIDSCLAPSRSPQEVLAFEEGGGIGAGRRAVEPAYVDRDVDAFAVAGLIVGLLIPDLLRCNAKAPETESLQAASGTRRRKMRARSRPQILQCASASAHEQQYSHRCAERRPVAEMCISVDCHCSDPCAPSSAEVPPRRLRNGLADRPRSPWMRRATGAARCSARLRSLKTLVMAKTAIASVLYLMAYRPQYIVLWPDRICVTDQMRR